MGLFEMIFKKPMPKQPSSDFKLLTPYRPTFTRWDGSIYENELVRAAIDARARHISKLKIEINGSARPTLQTQLKKQPNEWQTWGQFLYRTSTILDVHNTAVIVPVFDQYGQTVGVYSVLPQYCAIKQYGETPYLLFKFLDGKQAAVELSACAILTRFQYENEFFGSANAALTPTMELIDIQNQGIKEGVESAAAIRFMAQADNFMTAEDLAAERANFSASSFKNNNDSFLLFPSYYKNIQQVNSKPFIVDAEQMQTIERNVYNYFGVNADVLQNKAYGDHWAAFYEGAIEPFAIQFSETLTKALFTERERANGAYIMATSNRLQYMTTQEKLNVTAQMTDRGLMNRDEAREIWNLPPLPNGEGQAYIIRGEYKNADAQVNEEGNENE